MIDRIVVLNDLSEPMGGASQLAIRSAQAFVKSGIPVSFISGDSSHDNTGDGVEFVSLGQHRLLSTHPAKAALSGIWNADASRFVRAWIDQNDSPSTVYHLHGWTQILSPSLFAGLQQVAKRMVVSAHDFFSTCPNGAMFDFRRGTTCSLRPLGLNCVMTNCDRRHRAHKLWRVARHAMLGGRLGGEHGPPHLLIHAGMAPLLERGGLLRSRMAALPNPVSPWSPRRIEAESNSDVLFVGRIESTKGVGVAAEACRIADRRLLAVGGGADLAKLRDIYPDMSFPGRVAPEQVGEHARTARMLVMPSQYNEPFGLTAIEAAWSGIPVIISRHALIADDLVRAGAGIAVDPQDSRAIAEAINRIACDDDLARRMSENAFANTRDLALDFDEWIVDLLAGYRALLEGGADRLVEVVETLVRERTAAPEVRLT